MSQRVSRNAIYATGHDYGNGTHSVNRTGHVIYLCDCCQTRRQFATAAAADAHEDNSAAATRGYDLTGRW